MVNPLICFIRVTVLVGYYDCTVHNYVQFVISACETTVYMMRSERLWLYQGGSLLAHFQGT